MMKVTKNNWHTFGNWNVVKSYLLILGISLIWLGCDSNTTKPTSNNDDNKNQQQDTQTEVVKIDIPLFNSDSAYVFIEKQVAFGPRIPNTKEHVNCGNYLVSEFKRFGLSVFEQNMNLKAHTGEVLKAKNIIAEYKPETSNRILLCAHWDTRPFADRDPQNPKARFDGADDGGSGVGVLLEVARLISQSNLPIGVDFILFDAEDYGDSRGASNTYCLGSQYWAANPHRPAYYAKYGILLDMVGAKDAQFPREGWSMKFAPSIVEKVWNKAAQLGHSKYFVNELSDPITDDHYFINTIIKIPCIDIINYRAGRFEHGFAQHWHTTKDDMSVIDKNTLYAVGETLLHVLFSEK